MTLRVTGYHVQATTGGRPIAGTAKFSDGKSYSWRECLNGAHRPAGYLFVGERPAPWGDMMSFVFASPKREAALVAALPRG
jgi:hypothetical protein